MGQSGEASWWRVCYQWGLPGLPHLVCSGDPQRNQYISGFFSQNCNGNLSDKRVWDGRIHGPMNLDLVTHTLDGCKFNSCLILCFPQNSGETRSSLIVLNSERKLSVIP